MIQFNAGQSYSLVPTTQFVTTPGVTPSAVPMTGSFANVQVPTSFTNTFGVPAQASSTTPATGSRPSRLSRSIENFFANNGSEGLSTTRSGRRGRSQQDRAVGKMDRLFRDMERSGLTPTRQQQQFRAALATARDTDGNGRIDRAEVDAQARQLFGQQAMVANNAARPATATPMYSFVPMTFAQGAPVVTPQLQMPTVATQQQPVTATPTVAPTAMPAHTVTPQQLAANQTPPVPGRTV